MDSALGCSTTEPLRRRWARNPKVWGSIPHGDTEVFLFPTLVTRRKTSFSISLPSSKLTISLILITNMTPSTLLILAVCRTRVIWNLWQTSLTVESLWLSGGASKRGIRRSEVRILMRTQKCSFSHARDKTKNIFLEKLLFSHQFSRSRTEKGHDYFLKDLCVVLIFKMTLTVGEISV